jgi:hypothetical protein
MVNTMFCADSKVLVLEILGVNANDLQDFV